MPSSTPPNGARAAERWVSIEGQTLPVKLRIPFASEWQRHDTTSSLRLFHEGEQCSIVIRLWPSSRTANAEQCLSELSLVEPAAATARQTWLASKRQASDSEDDSTIVAQPFEPGGNFHGSLGGAVLTTRGAVITGSLVGIAAGVGRCLALVANTQSKGPNAETQIADRLAWLVEGVAGSLTVRSVEERIAPKR